MKYFETPEINIEKLDVSDVITVSGCTDDVVIKEDNETDDF